jgi:hypothetical protein
MSIISTLKKIVVLVLGAALCLTACSEPEPEPTFIYSSDYLCGFLPSSLIPTMFESGKFADEYFSDSDNEFSIQPETSIEDPYHTRCRINKDYESLPVIRFAVRDISLADGACGVEGMINSKSVNGSPKLYNTYFYDSKYGKSFSVLDSSSYYCNDEFQFRVEFNLYPHDEQLHSYYSMLLMRLFLDWVLKGEYTELDMDHPFPMVTTFSPPLSKDNVNELFPDGIPSEYSWTPPT